MASGQGDFDIQIKRDARWVTEAMRDKEIDARALAKKYLRDPQCAGVRVVANRIKRETAQSKKISSSKKPKPFLAICRCALSRLMSPNLFA